MFSLVENRLYVSGIAFSTRDLKILYNLLWSHSFTDHHYRAIFPIGLSWSGILPRHRSLRRSNNNDGSGRRRDAFHIFRIFHLRVSWGMQKSTGCHWLQKDWFPRIPEICRSIQIFYHQSGISHKGS